MKLFSLGIITILFFSYCGHENSTSVATNKFKSAVPAKPGVNYFPADSLFFTSVSKSNTLDSFFKQWYSGVLYKLKEPILYNYQGEGQSIRFVWLRSFKNPVVIRLNSFDDTVYVNIKELTIKYSTEEVPEIVKDTMITLDAEKWQESLSRLEVNNFWNAMTEDTSSNTVKDATAWFLECRLANKYHCVNRSDAGDFASKDLYLYAKELLETGERYVEMKSIR
jgi:hypothetical protein